MCTMSQLLARLRVVHTKRNKTACAFRKPEIQHRSRNISQQQQNKVLNAVEAPETSSQESV